MAHRP